MARKPVKKDNAGLDEKLRLRRAALEALGVRSPVIVEAYAGLGVIGSRLYVTRSAAGVAIEKDEAKACRLATDRPTWRVYEGDCIRALAAGLAADLEVSLLDLDPYGDPWLAHRAFWESERKRAPRLAVVVNDGLGKRTKMGMSWTTGSLRPIVARFGQDIFGDQYLTCCRWAMGRDSAKAGYRLLDFRGFRGGHGGQMSHFYGIFERDLSVEPPRCYVPECRHDWRCTDHPEVPLTDQPRPSARRRGYDAAWERTRAEHLRMEPWCRFCREEGRGKVAGEDVDHITPKPEGSDAHSNLRTLCHRCHSERTASDPRTRPGARNWSEGRA